MGKVAVYHFVNNNVGGVFSVVKNLVRFSQLPEIENHVIYTINKDIQPSFKIPEMEGVTSQRIFYYSPKWNFYYTCKQLAKLLPDDKVLVVAHDWLELGMMSNLGLQNPVVQIVHGNYDYYYNLCVKHQNVIDEFICVSPVIQKKLAALLTPQKASVAHYYRFPVPAVLGEHEQHSKLKIVYASGNLVDENKQFSLIPVINKLLQKNSVAVQWIIVGRGKTKADVQKLMHTEVDLIYLEQLANENLLDLLTTADIFLLPSLKEGFPVAVVEAMKAGLVPLVTNWEGSTAELIKDGSTGFYFEPKDAEGYARKIEELNSDRNLLNAVSLSAQKKANELFDPIVNTKIIEIDFVKVYTGSRQKKVAVKAYGSRLDEPWVNNFFTKISRRFFKK